MTEKKCPSGKILNPTTSRCVKVDGRIGKTILKAKNQANLPNLNNDVIGHIVKKLDNYNAARFRVANKKHKDIVDANWEKPHYLPDEERTTPLTLDEIKKGLPKKLLRKVPKAMWNLNENLTKYMNDPKTGDKFVRRIFGHGATRLTPKLFNNLINKKVYICESDELIDFNDVEKKLHKKISPEDTPPLPYTQKSKTSYLYEIIPLKSNGHFKYKVVNSFAKYGVEGITKDEFNLVKDEFGRRLHSDKIGSLYPTYVFLNPWKRK